MGSSRKFEPIYMGFQTPKINSIMDVNVGMIRLIEQGLVRWYLDWFGRFEFGNDTNAELRFRDPPKLGSSYTSSTCINMFSIAEHSISKFWERMTTVSATSICIHNSTATPPFPGFDRLSVSLWWKHEIKGSNYSSGAELGCRRCCDELVRSTDQDTILSFCALAVVEPPLTLLRVTAEVARSEIVSWP